MKKLWIFTSAVLVQLLVIFSLLIYAKTNSSKAVDWNVDGFTLTAAAIHGADDSETDKLNSEIRDYLDGFKKYDTENILCSHSYRVISDTKNVSVVEINTVLQHNITEESKEYTPAGEIYTELWVFNDNGKIKTNWVEKSNTSEEIPSDSKAVS
ncbi:MAG: hypothetical protein K2G60_01495 [Oscillospiraceae bacterium]|nr:hypothetical protein [Oscillospiraceae bacterium]